MQQINKKLGYLFVEVTGPFWHAVQLLMTHFSVTSGVAKKYCYADLSLGNAEMIGTLQPMCQSEREGKLKSHSAYNSLPCSKMWGLGLTACQARAFREKKEGPEWFSHSKECGRLTEEVPPFLQSSRWQMYHL